MNFKTTTMDYKAEADISQGNKLIAEFLGVFYDKRGSYMKVWVHGDEPTFFHCEWHPDDYKVEDNKFIAWEFAPHKNWCQLMPVVEKISQHHYADWGEKEHEFVDCAYPYTFGMRDAEGNYMVRIHANQLFTAKTLIEAAYMAVVDWIEWYNSQTPKEVNK